MKTMRAHQLAMNGLADKNIAGTWGKKSVTLDCTPGGGKTGAATLLANRLLDANYIDSILWIVPRLSLAEQVVEAFSVGFGAAPLRVLEVVDGQDGLFSPSLTNMPQNVNQRLPPETVHFLDGLRERCPSAKDLPYWKLHDIALSLGVSIPKGAA